LTVAAATTTGTGLAVSTGNGMTSGAAATIDTGTSAFSTVGGGLRMTSTGAFTGTLASLSANSTTTGTILGISGTALTTGRAVDINLGTAIYTRYRCDQRRGKQHVDGHAPEPLGDVADERPGREHRDRHAHRDPTRRWR